MHGAARAAGLVLVVGLGVGACQGARGLRGEDQFRGRPSPTGTWVLRPSKYDGTLVRLTIERAADGTVVDRFDSRDTDAMKWAAGWADADTVVFHGTDTGTTVARRFDGTRWQELTLDAPLCARLHAVFVEKYGDDFRGTCP